MGGVASTLGEFLSTSLVFEGMNTATPLRKKTICLFLCLSLGLYCT